VENEEESGSVRIGQLTAEDMQRGFIVCNCGTYAYVFRGHVLTKLPGGQVGELCAECGAYMVRVEKLREAGFDVPANEKVEAPK
jgi:hypothetical protein